MRGNKRLPQAEPAVTGWHFSVGKNLETILSEPRLQVLKQIDVLKSSPAQADTVELRALAQQAGEAGKNLH